MDAIKLLLTVPILATTCVASASTVQTYSIVSTNLTASYRIDENAYPTLLPISGSATGTGTLDSSGVLTMNMSGEQVIDISALFFQPAGSQYSDEITSSTIALNTTGAYQLSKTGSTNTTASCINGPLDSVNSCALLALNTPATLYGFPADYSSQSFSLAGGTINLKSIFAGSIVTTAYTLQAVPVPTAAWLLGSGLLGLTGLARKRKAA